MRIQQYLLIMNHYMSSTVLTQMSQFSVNENQQLLQKIDILQTQNAEFKRRWEASNMLNMTLKQALITISKKGKIDTQLLDKLKQLSTQTISQSSPETLGQLRQFYESQIKKIQYQYTKQIQQLHYKHQQEIKILKDKLERQNRQKLTNDREEMLKQIKDYMKKQKIRSQNSKENKTVRSKNSSTSSHKKKNSLLYSDKSKILSSQNNSLQSSYRRMRDTESQQSYIRSSASSSRGKIATEIQCSYCHRIFSTNEFVSHVNTCNKNEQYIFQKPNRAPYKKDKIIEDLIKRKQQIQSQLQNIALKNQKSSRQILQTDLDQIIYVISNTSSLSDQYLQAILQNSNQKFSLPKMGINKKQVVVKRVR